MDSQQNAENEETAARQLPDSMQVQENSEPETQSFSVNRSGTSGNCTPGTPEVPEPPQAFSHYPEYIPGRLKCTIPTRIYKKNSGRSTIFKMFTKNIFNSVYRF